MTGQYEGAKNVSVEFWLKDKRLFGLEKERHGAFGGDIETCHPRGPGKDQGVEISGRFQLALQKMD